ncbi:MAG: O-antigen ligase family protein [bacterium]|nr:O-antigen ligase family protein [bacterium]
MSIVLIAAILIVGVVFTFLSLRWPIVLILAILLVLGMDYIGKLIGFITMNNALKAVFIVIFFIRAGITGEKIRVARHLIDFLPFLIIVGLSITHTGNLSTAMIGWSRFAFTWVFAVLVANVVKTGKDLRLVVTGILLSVLVVASMALIQGLQLFSSGPLATHAMEQAMDTGTRVSGSFWSPNKMAMYLVSLSIFLFAMIPGRQLSARAKLLHAVVLVLSFVAILMSLSRSGWVAICLAGFLFLFSKTHRRTTLVCGILGLICVVVVLIATPYGVSLLERLQSLQEISTGTSSGARLVLYSTGLDIFLTGFNWIWGCGYKSFTHEIVEHLHPLMSHDVYYHAGIRNSHNAWIDMATELGLLGLMAFLFFIRSVYREISLMLRKSMDIWPRSILIAICVLFTVKLVDFNFNPEMQVGGLWFAMGLLGAIGGMVESHKSR